MNFGELLPWSYKVTPAETTRTTFYPLHREMDRLIDDFFASPSATRVSASRQGLSVNVKETEKSFLISAPIPGFDKDSVKVHLEGDRLTISGEVKEEGKKQEEGYSYQEWSTSSFSRSFTLPEGVDAGKITADFDKGVLNITLPKTQDVKAKSRTIEIKGGGKAASA
ncbi:MAG: Hsp20/alpha crystallin family protein [Planctomycetota bacterium]